MKDQAVVHKGPNNYGASVPDLPGVYAFGDTLEEMRELLAGAIDIHIRALVADGEHVPEPTHIELLDVALPETKLV